MEMIEMNFCNSAIHGGANRGAISGFSPEARFHKSTTLHSNIQAGIHSAQ